MSTDTPPSDRSRRDPVIAGEYVLGVLSAEDRRKVEARMVLDRDFAMLVGGWEESFDRFTEAEAPVVPPVRVFSAVERRLFGAAAGRASAGLWNSLAVWRGLTLAAVAGILALGLLDGRFSGMAPQNPALVAEMTGGNGINLLARYDAASGRLRVTPVAARDTGERSLELWLIEGENPAKSLGILPQTGEGELIVPPEIGKRLAAGATLAVSLEPFGGSPTGTATGPVIAVGTARHL